MKKYCVIFCFIFVNVNGVKTGKPIHRMSERRLEEFIRQKRGIAKLPCDLLQDVNRRKFELHPKYK